jgi:hypothetical protein
MSIAWAFLCFGEEVVIVAKPSIDKDKAARALAQWALKQHRRAFASSVADSFEISERTLWRWKNSLEDDDELSALYEEKLNELCTQDWVQTLDQSMNAYLSRMLELAPTAPLPDATEALKTLAEIKLTKEVLTPNAATTNQSKQHESTGGTPQTAAFN